MRGSSRLRTFGRELFLLSAISLLFVVTAFLLQGGMGAPDMVSAFLETMRGGFTIAFCIGGVSWLVMPVVAVRVGHLHLLLRWPIYLATMTGTAVVGTLLAGLVYFYAFGYDGGRPFRSLLGESLRHSIPITWVIGSIITVVGTATARLQATELALRNQQLEKERAEKLAAEAQFASLASRVQPHFLFNTLNSISALVREDPAQAEVLVERLSSLLRSSLDGAQTVPLEQELKLVADYLKIQQVRFGERLRYEVLPARRPNVPVPPFAAQTIVENALKHVGSRRPEGVTVRVRAIDSGDDLVVEVTDDGPGFAEDSLKGGHGLDNLQRRLRALYGDRAGLDFLPNASGMTVRLRVPAS